MQIPKYKKYDVLRVVWIDAFTNDSPWSESDAAVKEQGQYIVQTVGFYLGQDKEYMRLSMSRGNKDDTCMFFNIPLGMIRECERLRVGKMVKTKVEK